MKNYFFKPNSANFFFFIIPRQKVSVAVAGMVDAYSLSHLLSFLLIEPHFCSDVAQHLLGNTIPVPREGK